MSEDQLNNESENLVASFHQVESLIPATQELVTIAPEMPVSEVLALMQVNHFSQLPVMAGNAVLGIFSYRSFSKKLMKQTQGGNSHLGKLPVEDFLDDYEYVHPDEDWTRILRYLDQDDAFLVGYRTGLDGIVTTMDMLNYFREIANPFIMVAEIELSLRVSFKYSI